MLDLRTGRRVTLAVVCLLALSAGLSPSNAGAAPLTVSEAGARLWVGLRNGDDQGTRFDVRTELYVSERLVAEGETRCVTGVTRNPGQAKEVSVSFGPVTDGEVVSGDVLALRVLTRIGTNANGTACGGHASAVGLRLYYDAVSRPSRFGATIAPSPQRDQFLRAPGGLLRLDTASPTATQAGAKDSAPVTLNRGNRWTEVGTWRRAIVLPAEPPGGRFSATGPGGSIPDGFGSNISGAPFLSTVTVPAAFAGPISKVWVELRGLVHTWVGDVRARLIHPDGVTSIELLSRPGRGIDQDITSSTFGFPSDFVAARTYAFSDNGTILFDPHPFGGPPGGWLEGPGIPSGVYRPSSNPNSPDSNERQYLYTPASFAATFGGMSAAGGWTLEISDWANGDTGSLEGWTLNMCSGRCPDAPAGVGDELFKLTAFEPFISWEFGAAVALSGNTAIIGAPGSGFYGGPFQRGAAYLFDVTTGEEFPLLPPADHVEDRGRAGTSVAINSNIALVGAPYHVSIATNRSTGSVYVFDVSDRSNPVELPRLFPSDDAPGHPAGTFGASVAIRGTLAVVGASGDTHGLVYLFDVTTGRELVKFTASDTAPGDNFGGSVAISGNTLIVGASGTAVDSTGAAYLFDVSDPRHPVERFKLTASDSSTRVRSFGRAAISGNLAVVGAPFSGEAFRAIGAAYLFDVTSGQQLAKLTPATSEPGSSIGIGWSLAISGNTVLVGAPFADNDTDGSSGAVYVFDVSDPRRPVQTSTLTASDAEDGDWFGTSVALRGDAILVGAPQFFGEGKAFLYRGRSLP